MQDLKTRQKIAIFAPSTNLSGYFFATKAHIDNRKNSLSSNIFSTCTYNMVNFGLLAAEIVSFSLVWGSPANFNGFRVLAALLHGTPVLPSAKLCGVEQRAPPILGRAAITLGIGAHFYFNLHLPSVWASLSVHLVRRRYTVSSCDPYCSVVSAKFCLRVRVVESSDVTNRK